MTSTPFAALSLYTATPAQTIESRKRTADQWARGLSLEAYLERDSIMDTHEHAAGGKLVTWVLAPRASPTTLDFLCSCETFRRMGIVAKRAKEVDAREVREVTAYGIASVYTPPRNRGKGYAKYMMRLLHWALAPRSALPPSFPAEWGAPPDDELLRSAGVANGQFSVLYSDVGRDFYQAAGLGPSTKDGWVVHGALETSKLIGSSTVASTTEKTPDLNIQILSEEDVIALYDRDTIWIKDDLSRIAGDTDHTLFSFLPDKGVGAFVVRRTMEFRDGSKPVLPSTQWGLAILPPGTRDLKDALSRKGLGPLHFVTWTLDLPTTPRTLTVARLRADVNTFPVILDQLLAVAREEKVEKVELWYLRPELRAVADAKGWATRERPEHLSAVKWYGDEREDELEWVYNEKSVSCLMTLVDDADGDADFGDLDSAGARSTRASRVWCRRTGYLGGRRECMLVRIYEQGGRAELFAGQLHMPRDRTPLSITVPPTQTRLLEELRVGKHV
ncbi:hypothetical protein C8Q78DRAFT_967627 [Trametes maxima]|nr:hypothetical protein C8Q78DRAFT_967627 [Trametes maxima]